jgi:hypothetical protein
MEKIELQGYINDTGKLSLYQSDVLHRWIRNHKDTTVVLSINERRKRRSNLQNAYYFGVLVAMVQEAMNSFGNDYTSEEVHEFLKKEFNYEEKEIGEGYYIKVPRSTTRLTTVEFSDYKEKIQQFASSVLGIYIPDPGEAVEIKFDT